MVDADAIEYVHDMIAENSILQSEMNNLRLRVKALQETVETIKLRNIELLSYRDTLNITASGSKYFTYLLSDRDTLLAVNMLFIYDQVEIHCLQ